MKISKVHVAVFLGVAAAIWALILVVQGQPLTAQLLAPFGTVVGVMAVLYVALDRWLWAIGWLQPRFVARPDIRGTWKVVMKSDWVDPNTGNAPITCYVGVEQSLTTLKMHLMTVESKSSLIAQSITPSPINSTYEVAGLYSNCPGIDRRETSAIHRGAFLLETHGAEVKPTTLSGEYWTDRKTCGRMDFIKRVDAIYTRFDDSANAFDLTKSDDA